MQYFAAIEPQRRLAAHVHLAIRGTITRTELVMDAEAAGLTVVDLREFRGRMEFYDIAAVVHFLRKVIWIVPEFTAEAYRDRLRALHNRIESDGPFVATSVRFSSRPPSRRRTEPADLLR